MGLKRFWIFAKHLNSLQILSLFLLLFGLYFVIWVDHLSFKILGAGITLLSFVGFFLFLPDVIRQSIIEEKKPSEELPKTLQTEEQSDSKSKRLVFRELDSKEEKQEPTDAKEKKLFSTFFKFFTKPISLIRNKQKKGKDSIFPQKKQSKNLYSEPQDYKSSIQDEHFENAEEGIKIIRKIKKEDYEKSKPQPEIQTQASPAPVEIKSEQKIEKVEEATEPVEENELLSQIPSKDKIIPKPFHRKPIEFEAKKEHTERLYLPEKPIEAQNVILKKLLKLVRAVSYTKTASLFLVNEESKILQPILAISDLPDDWINKEPFTIGGDFVSQIATSGNPEIMYKINPNAELDLIPYYKQHVGIKSFAGVPIKREGRISAVLCADSTKEDAYDEFKMIFLINLAETIGLFLDWSSDSIRNEVSSKILQISEKIFDCFPKTPDNSNPNYSEIVNLFLKNFSFSTSGLVLFSEELNNYQISEIKSNYSTENKLKLLPIDVKRSIVAKSIFDRKTILSHFSEQTIRLHPLETKFKQGTIISIPIQVKNRVYGAFFAFVDKKIFINKFYQKKIETFVYFLSQAIDSFYTKKAKMPKGVREFNNIQFLDKAIFTYRLKQEIERCNHFGGTFTFCEIAFDRYSLDEAIESRVSSYASNILLNLLGNILMPFDIIGRVDGNIIGIIFVGRKLKDIKFDLETIRRTLAQTPIKLNKDTYYSTISIGIVEFFPNSNFEKLTESCREALKASLKRGNTITSA